MSTRESNPWDLTREHPEAYSDWREQACNGETLKGFAEWLADGMHEAES